MKGLIPLDNVIQRPLSLSPLPPHKVDTSQSWGRIFKAGSSCCLISISSLFLSFTTPSRAMLQLWPHFLCHFLPSAWTLLKLSQVMHLYYIIVQKLASDGLILFFLFWSRVCVKMSARPECTTDNKAWQRPIYSLAMSICVTSYEYDAVLRVSIIFVKQTHKLTWKRVETSIY